MNIVRTITIVGLSLTVLACSKDKDKPSEDQPGTKTPAAKTPAPKAPAAKVPTGQGAAIDAIMAQYEICRAQLAADESDGVAGCAKAMNEAAVAAAGSLSDAVKVPVQAVAAAAQKLAETKMDDIEALRLAYGEVSKHVMAVLMAAPEAAQNYHVFECPMAKGYKRWAQADAKMANPYMGKKMLECGSEVHDHHTTQSNSGSDHATKHN